MAFTRNKNNNNKINVPTGQPSISSMSIQGGIENLVNELENSLAQTFSCIILGNLKAKDMKSLKGKLNSKNTIPNKLFDLLSGKNSIEVKSKEFSNINKSLNNINRNITDISKHLPQTDKFYDAVEGIYKTLSSNAASPSKTTAPVNKESVLKFVVDGNTNVKDIVNDIVVADENNKDISKAKTGITNLGEYFKAVKDVNDNEIKDAALSSTVGKKYLSTLKGNNEELSSLIKNNAYIDDEDITLSMEHSLQLAAAITLLSATMLIGANILKKHPELQENSIKFIAITTLFLTAILLPLSLVQWFVGDMSDKWGEIAFFVMLASFTMMIGAKFMKNKDNPINALKFTGVFSLFLLGMSVGIAIIGSFSKSYVRFAELSLFIISATIVMMIGAMFVRKKENVANALKFTGVFAVFIVGVLGTIALLSGALGRSNSYKLIQEISKFIVTATIVMTIGALFMMIGNGKYAKNVIYFALLLAAFEFLVLAPIAILTGILPFAKRGMEGFSKFVVAAAAVMTIGALFMMWDAFPVNALKFTGLLFVFIMATVLPMIVLYPFILFGWLAIKHFRKLVIEIAAVVIIGALFVLLGGGKFVISAIVFTAVVGIFVAALVLILTWAATGLKGATGSLFMLAFTVAVVSGILLYAAYLMQDDNVVNGAWRFLGFMFIFVVGWSAIFGLIAAFRTQLKEAAITLMLMGGAILLVGVAVGAFIYVAKLAAEVEWMVLLKVGAIVVACAAIFGVIGIPVIAEAVGLGSFVAMLMGAGLATLSWGLTKLLGICELISNIDDNDLKTLALVLLSATGIFGIIALASPLILLASAVIVPFSAAIMKIGNAIKTLVESTLLTKGLSKDDVDALGEYLKHYTKNVIGNLSSLKLLKDISIANKVCNAMAPISMMISELGKTINDLANLRIVDSWDANGNPKSYRNLSNTDFTNAAENIKKIITTISGALIEVYNANPDLFKETSKSGIAGFFGAKNPTPFSMVVRSTSTLGTLISTLGESVAMYAALRIPTKWDKDGKPIDFRHLGPDDFNNASTSIKTVIETVAKSICEFISDNPEYVELMRESIDITSLSKTSDFGVVVHSVSTLGKLISDIAAGVQNFANLTIPMYDKNGNEIGKRLMKETDFTNASKNITKIMGTLIGVISAIVADDNIMKCVKDIPHVNSYGWGFVKTTNMEQSPFMKVIGALSSISTIIGTVADSISVYARGEIPYTNERGKTSFVKLDDDAYVNIKKHISSVLTSLITAVNDVTTNEDVLSFIGETNLKNLDKIIESYTKITELNNKGIDAIVNFTKKYAEVNTVSFITYIMLYTENTKLLLTAINSIVTSNIIDKDYNSKIDTIKNVFVKLDELVSDETKYIKNILGNVKDIDYEDSIAKLENVDTLTGKIIEVINNTITTTNKLASDNNAKELNDCVRGLGYLNTMIEKYTEIQTSINEISNKFTSDVLTSSINNLEKLNNVFEKLKSNISGITEFITSPNIKVFCDSFSRTIGRKGIGYATFDLLESVINTIQKISTKTEKLNPNSIDILTEVLCKLNNLATTTQSENTSDSLDKTAKSLDKYVKAVNNINIRKANAVNDLVSGLNELADKIGNFELFTDLLSNKLAQTLSELSKEMKSAEDTIKLAEKVQSERHTLIKESVKEIKDMLSTNALRVDVTAKNDGSVSINEEK